MHLITGAYQLHLKTNLPSQKGQCNEDSFEAISKWGGGVIWSFLCVTCTYYTLLFNIILYITLELHLNSQCAVCVHYVPSWLRC